MLFYCFNDTATTEIYTLSLHDALPIWWRRGPSVTSCRPSSCRRWSCAGPCSSARWSWCADRAPRSEEHTSELQSRQYLVCRLLLEKKKNELFYTPLTTSSPTSHNTASV